MGPPSSSGFYVSRAVALLLAGLAAALLLVLAVLAALYGHCARVAPSELQDCGVPDAAPSPPGGMSCAASLNVYTDQGERSEHIPCYSNFGPRTCCSCNTWELVGKADTWAPPSIEGIRIYVLTRSSGDFRALTLEKRGTVPPGRPYALSSLSLPLFQSARALLASQMEPTFARNVFPCFDEPGLKATFNITLIHHPSYVALSNMPKLGQSEKEDVNGSKWTVTTFHTTPRMSTYLATFAICDYDHVSRTERGKEIRIWARKDAIANGTADFALNITGPIFSFLEDLFNISYPLPKTDIIALPAFDNRAMENWGLIIFDESLLLLQPDDQLTEKKMVISYIVSHEVGHQWFGNLVTMSWWNDIWLNEGVASYFEFGVINYLYPKLPKNEVFFSNILYDVLQKDHALVSRAVSTKMENFTETNEINELFDLFTYNKGASVARMLASFLNENLFISALKSYLETFSYLNAEQDDLWRHFQMAIDDQSKIILPATVKSIMDSWTHQSGFPVITLNVSTGVVKQEPFYLGKFKNQTLEAHNISLEKLFEAACLLGLEDCLQLSRELFKNWTNHPENEYMEYAITTSPSTFDERNIIEDVAESEVGRYIVKDFLVNNWQAVNERYGPQSLIILMYIIGRTISTDLQIMELQQFFSPMLEEHQRLAVYAKLQTIKNGNLKNRNRNSRIAAWLRKNT
ncbi:PREDICTED: aminopeptidase Q [Hipposideros armiger]|uniref:Aminopeptidase Q n=1 Tax=Hipposideros armiger TaxID=186990 RepID=A0A8B7S172_HIPAR|nr:PREDICTED: aminopeptidase Q [Hipposideros armiger]